MDFRFNLQRFADTEIVSVAPDLVKVAWALDTWESGMHKAFFDKFTGNSPENIIQIREELSKDDGDTINIPLLMPLMGNGVEGDDILEGNEEAMIYRDFKVTINQLRHAVRIKGKMEEQRVSLDLRKDAKVALSNWLADKIDKTIFKELSTAPTADRIVYGGSATSEANIGASDTFSTALIGKAKRIALADENTMVKPVMIDGLETYIMVIDQWQARDLKNDQTWIEAQNALSTISKRLSQRSIPKSTAKLLRVKTLQRTRQVQSPHSTRRLTTEFKRLRLTARRFQSRAARAVPTRIKSESKRRRESRQRAFHERRFCFALRCKRFDSFHNQRRSDFHGQGYVQRTDLYRPHELNGQRRTLF